MADELGAMETLVVRIGSDTEGLQKGYQEAAIITERYTRDLQGKYHDAKGRYVEQGKVLLAYAREEEAEMAKARAARQVLIQSTEAAAAANAGYTTRIKEMIASLRTADGLANAVFQVSMWATVANVAWQIGSAIFSWAADLEGAARAMDKLRESMAEVNRLYDKMRRGQIGMAEGYTDPGKRERALQFEEGKESQNIQAYQAELKKLQDTYDNLTSAANAWGTGSGDLIAANRAQAKDFEERLKGAKSRMEEIHDAQEKGGFLSRYKKAENDLDSLILKLQENQDLLHLKGGARDLKKAEMAGLGGTSEYAKAKGLVEKGENDDMDKKLFDLYKRAQSEAVAAGLSNVERKYAALRLEVDRDVDSMTKHQKFMLKEIQDYYEMADARTKAAEAEKEANRQREATDKLIKQSTDSMKEQLATYGMDAQQKEIWKLKQLGANESVITNMKQMSAQLKAKEEDKKLTEEANKIIEKQKGPLDTLIEQRDKLNKMYESNKLTMDQYTKAMEEAEQQAHKDYTAQFRTSGVDAVAAGSAEMMSKLEEYRLGARALPTMTTRRTSDRIAMAEAGNPYAGRPDLANQTTMNTPEADPSVLLLSQLLDLAKQYWTQGVALNLTSANLGGG